MLPLVGLWSPKIREMLDGRKKSVSEIAIFFSNVGLGKRIWMHCASLGEFEQGKPVLEAIKQQYPNAIILLTFFSPSGYRVRKNWSGADLVCYLPGDTRKEVSYWISVVKPELFILVKYEFWWILLETLHQKGIRTILISGSFSKKHYIFMPAMNSFRKILKSMNHIFLQDESSADLLRKFGINHITVSGDNRVDSVLQNKEVTYDPEWLTVSRQKYNKAIVYGSVWEQDLPAILPVVKHRIHDIHIIAPHDISPENIAFWQESLNELTGRVSHESSPRRIWIVDVIGQLKYIYRFANAAYIGGGFGSGLHNTLEPAVYEIPLFFGPKYDKFVESKIMVEQGTAFAVKTGKEFEDKLSEILDNQEIIKNIRYKHRQYFNLNAGATSDVMNYIVLNIFSNA